MKKIEKFFGLCLYFWRVPCPAWGWAARCRATWRTGCGWRPGRWRSGGHRPGWSRSPPPGTMVPAPCPHYLPGFCWFGSLDGCLTTKIFVYTKNICVRVFPVPCPVSAVAELSPIVHNSVSMSPDCECIQSCQMLKRLSRITVICMSYYHLSSIRSLTLFTNNIVNIQEWLIQEFKICNLSK